MPWPMERPFAGSSSARPETAGSRYGRLLRRFRNFSKNRPETTNLSHQYTIRRVFICPVLDAWSAPGRIVGSSEPDG